MGFGSMFGRSSKKNMLNSALSCSNNSPADGGGTGETPLFSRSSSMNSASQVEELQQVFRKFDVNGDGKISATELGCIIRSLGQSPTEEELMKMVRVVDKDGDGFIDLDEFIELNTKDVGSDEALQSLREAFSVFDIDGNGSITAEELHKVLRGLGEDCSVAECRKMISGVDVDGDGMISFDEFKIMMDTGSRYEHKMLEDSQQQHSTAS
uniref:EF-hand domain-containing protein n=1 Tax=Kalanchoe fedtschenkoi TaxID=63787 RepID=A0A7N0VAJ1_KALFE